MSIHDAQFIRELQAAFHAEAQEHLQAISAGLLDLETIQRPEDARKLIEVIFRETHSLKGAARTVSFADIERVCQELESVFAGWKSHGYVPQPADLDVVLQGVDCVATLATRAREGTVGESPSGDPLIESLRALHPEPRSARERPGHEAVAAKEVAAAKEVVATKEAAAAKEAAASATGANSPSETTAAVSPHSETPETVRISIAKLDALLRQAEELLVWKLASSQRVAALHQLQEAVQTWERQWARLLPDWRGLQQAIERSESGTAFEAAPNLDRAASEQRAASGFRSVSSPSASLPVSSSEPTARLLDFVDWSHTWIKSLEGRLTAVSQVSEQEARSLGGMVDHLLDDAKRLLMLPFSTLLAVLPKLVRDLARDQGKQVRLEIRGGEVEIDKRILEELKDPLIHLVRNSIDHGMEKPAERSARGKPPEGSLTVTISQVDGNKVQLILADDGGGIDAARVREVAVRQGLLSAERAGQLDERESLALIFLSGVSTSRMLTEVSGRGLGMAIVREKVERLGGQISIQTQVGRGTSFRLLLPLTMATFRGLVVRAGDQSFIIPTAQVERVVRVRADAVRHAAGQPLIELDGAALSLVWLEQVLQLPAKPSRAPLNVVTAVVLGSGDQRIAYAVTEVLQEQEVLIKSLGPPLVRVRNVAGAAVLGSGKPVLILNPADLLASALQSPLATVPVAAVETPEGREKRVLVAEDSITARMLLKNILESAGYHVTAVVDGADAWTALKTEPFDLLVSDIQMPRLNGFDLTSRIRGERKLADLPVVLVTALASREDRERGIDVGANAYIVKSSFDQGNLLEVVRRWV
jgi:two-component system chemotaxis sensor kinase CheA